MDPEDPNFPHEEYALLIGSTGAGTARRIHSRIAASRNSTDVALADVMLDARPSGIVLPKILRRKLRLLNRVNDIQQVSDGTPEAPINNVEYVKKQTEQTLKALDGMARAPLLDRVAHHDAKRLHSKSPIAYIQNNYDQIVENYKDNIREHLPKNYETPSSYKRIDRSRVFTCSELEKKLSKANAALLDIQKQLQRGEEIYFLDTDTHGNIYKGWEAFIDAKPEHIGIQDADCIPFDEASLLAPTTASAAPSRKMHADLRWFSSSSYAIENGSIRKFDRKKKKSLTPTRSTANFSSISNISPIPSFPPSIERQLEAREISPADIVSSLAPQPVFKAESMSVSAPPSATNAAPDAAPASSPSLAQKPEIPTALPENSSLDKLPGINSETLESKKEEETDDSKQIVANDNNNLKDPIDIDNDKEVQSDNVQDMTSRKDTEVMNADDDQVANENMGSSCKNLDTITVADLALVEDPNPKSESQEDRKEEIKIQNDKQESLEDGRTGQKRKQEDLEDDEEQDFDTRSSSRLRKKTKI